MNWWYYFFKNTILFLSLQMNLTWPQHWLSWGWYCLFWLLFFWWPLLWRGGFYHHILFPLFKTKNWNEEIMAAFFWQTGLTCLCLAGQKAASWGKWHQGQWEHRFKWRLSVLKFKFETVSLETLSVLFTEDCRWARSWSWQGKHPSSKHGAGTGRLSPGGRSQLCCSSF